MTELKNGILNLKEEKPTKCELCSEIEELRPYGPNGENICYVCAMKNKQTTGAAFEKVLKKSSLVIKDNVIISIPTKNRTES